jgi:hypothetical protein
LGFGFGILRPGPTIENEFRILQIYGSARREPVGGRLEPPWSPAIEISGCRSLFGQTGLGDQIGIVELQGGVGNETICLEGLFLSDGVIGVDLSRSQ